jgi:hypothetical protein
MLFKKDDLLCTYNWISEEQASIFKGTPSRRKFDRHNGAQVLFIINSIASGTTEFSIQKGQEIEALIANNLSLATFSEVSVINWLQNFKETGSR